MWELKTCIRAYLVNPSKSEFMMEDEIWKRTIRSITDPKELLREVSRHFANCSSDPYYRDMTDVLLAHCDKLAGPEKEGESQQPTCTVCCGEGMVLAKTSVRKKTGKHFVPCGSCDQGKWVASLPAYRGEKK